MKQKTNPNLWISSILPLGCAILGSWMFSLLPASAADRPPTYCNPVNLPYRFQPGKDTPHREAADPTLITFRNEYWLFPSHSGGYWYSRDCLHWIYVPCKTLPIENYAPTAWAFHDHLLWAVGGSGIWMNDDPAQDTWREVSHMNCPADVALFSASDGELFLYGGCSDKKPTTGQELDPVTFQPRGPVYDLVSGDPTNHGWESFKLPPWIEGSWMTEHDGVFYYQYAGPGTERPTYGDGVYTSRDPLTGFTFAPYSPFSFKPTGFITSAGHSSMFQDFAGHYWRVCTMLVGARADFERRIGLFPAGFLKDGQLTCDTYLGDYPHYLPGADFHPAHAMPGWMLLSYRKPAQASSTFDAAHGVEKAFDENIRDWWSASSGDKGESLKVDLGKPCQIEAIQINFADEGADAHDMLQGDAYQYVIDTSSNGTNWTVGMDKSRNTVDAPHDYVQLPAPVTARYVRITNLHCPAGAKFSISGLRVFGNGLGKRPHRVTGITATREPDQRRAVISWSPVPNADFYIVRYGLARDRMFANYQVYDGTRLEIASLNVGVSYVLTVDAVNDSGIRQGTQIVTLPASK